MLSEDTSVKSCDRAKIRGYYTKWIQGKYLLGCAMFIDLLTPCSIFSKTLQSDEVDILAALNGVLKTMKDIEKLQSKQLDQWSTYAATTSKIASDGEEKVYQCQAIRRYSEAQSYYQSHFQDYCSKVTECIRS